MNNIKYIEIPKKCPSCNGDLIIKSDNGREMLYCTNDNCKAIILDRLNNFVGRNCMNISGLSEERLRTLMDIGLVCDFKSIYELKNHRDEITKIQGFGESSADKLIEAIEDSKKCELTNVIVAIGIPGIGKSAAKLISKHCQTFARLIEFALSDYDWTVLPEVGVTTSDNINAYIKNNLDDIQPLVDILDVKELVINTSGKQLLGKTFCITGKLFDFTNRNALVDDIENCGGKVVSSVTAKTDYLITNDKDSGSSKNKSAEKFGTIIITEKEYIALRDGNV